MEKYGIEWAKSDDVGVSLIHAAMSLELIKHCHVSPNFYLSEYQCQCDRCKGVLISPSTELVRYVQAIRGECDCPITISGPLRCYRHNQEVGGADDSRHLPEHADGVDLACPESMSIDQFINVIRHVKAEIGIKGGIGLYPDRVHVDTRGYDAEWDER